MDTKKKILRFYYEKNKNIIEIANSLKVTKQYVSKIIKSDPRYCEEKNQRKEQTKIKKNTYINKKKKERRYENLVLDAYVEQMHDQASRELSKAKGTISNRAFRNWNSSIYKYNKKTKSYNLKSGILVGSDVPKRINWN